MEFFETEGSQDTEDKTAEIELVFPKKVDHVVLIAFLNDHHLVYRWHFRPIGDGKVWQAVCTQTGQQPGRWIPSIKVLGIKK